MRVGIIDKVFAMREFRERLVSAGLPSKELEYDVLGNVCAASKINRQTATSWDYAIAEIDGVQPLLMANIARKAINGAVSG
jgi:hypothetical protein